MKRYSDQQLRCLEAMGLQAWQVKPAFEVSELEARCYAIANPGLPVYVALDFFQGQSASAQEAMFAAIMKAMQWEFKPCDALPQDQSACWVLALGAKVLSKWAPLPVEPTHIQQRAGITWLAVDSLLAMMRNPQLKKRSWECMQRFKQRMHEHAS